MPGCCLEAALKMTPARRYVIELNNTTPDMIASGAELGPELN